MVTGTQFHTLDTLYNYYNKKLFHGELPDCMILTGGHKNDGSFFKMRSWKSKLTGEEPFIHEINLNPGCFDQDDSICHAELVHGMVHVWQRDYGKASRGNYHNRQWAQKAEGAGLMPSSTGKPGGRRTGQKMSQYIIPGGRFAKAFQNLADKRIKYVPSALEGGNEAAKKARSKTKYTCPLCTTKVWGKAGLAITCGDCNQQFKQAD